MSGPANKILIPLLSKHLPSKPISLHPIGGGSINDCYRVNLSNETLFCKTNSASAFPGLFQKEVAGLALVAKQGIIKTPSVIDCFEEGDTQVLLLEWTEPGERTETFWKAFGEQLAALHQTANESFGLNEDNYMGSVPQSNRAHHTWTAFFVQERIAPMTQLCFDKMLLSKSHLHQFQNLQSKLDSVFETEKPSLLHGDLWSGNFLCNKAGRPVLIDPAAHFGHRSVDLAMTTLFGGFRPSFYEAYHHHLPFPKNAEEQWAVCNLYPLLIHLYLFGASYLPPIERTLQRFG